MPPRLPDITTLIPREIPRRKIMHRIFFGNPDMCAEMVPLAHKRLDDAFEIIGALQQPDDIHESQCDEDDRERRDLEAEVVLIVQDLLVALDMPDVAKTLDNRTFPQGAYR